MKTNETPQSDGSIIISNITSSPVIIGNGNHLAATFHFEKFDDSSEKEDPKLWEEVSAQMEVLLKEVKALGDEHEDLRDIELTPAVGLAKKEVAAIINDPKKDKKSFIEKFKSICELSGKVVDVGTKLAPFIVTIGKLLGITI